MFSSWRSGSILGVVGCGIVWRVWLLVTTKEASQALALLVGSSPYLAKRPETFDLVSCVGSSCVCLLLVPLWHVSFFFSVNVSITRPTLRDLMRPPSMTNPTPSAQRSRGVQSPPTLITTQQPHSLSHQRHRNINNGEGPRSASAAVWECSSIKY